MCECMYACLWLCDCVWFVDPAKRLGFVVRCLSKCPTFFSSITSPGRSFLCSYLINVLFVCLFVCLCVGVWVYVCDVGFLGVFNL